MTQLSTPVANINLTTARIQTNSGILKGLFAVILFAMTVPMTKLALPVFSPELIASCRAFFAGLLALAVILFNGWSLPRKTTLAWLLLAGSGVVIGFPYLLSYCLMNLSAASMGIVLAGLPIMTSLFAVVIMKERNGIRFWLSSALGAGLLAIYFLNISQSSSWGLRSIGLLTLVLVFAGLGYSAGARAAKDIGGWQAICWILVLYLPLSAIAFGYFAGDEIFVKQFNHAINSPNANEAFWLPLLGVLYLAVVSQWWGFRFWYQAMAEAGAGRISQIQLLQPFFTLLFAIIFLAESFDFKQLIFATLIAITVCSALSYKQKS